MHKTELQDILHFWHGVAYTQKMKLCDLPAELHYASSYFKLAVKINNLHSLRSCGKAQVTRG